MRAGDLDRVAVLQRGTFDDATGAWVFASFATVRAKVREATGREFLAGNAVMGERRATITIRFRDDVALTDRVLVGSTTYGVVSTREIGRRVALELLVNQVT